MVGAPDIRPGRVSADVQGKRIAAVLLPKKMRKFAAAVCLVCLGLGFTVGEVANPYIEKLLPSNTESRIWVEFDSIPQGASVKVNGEGIEGKTPILKRMALPIGEHTISFSLGDADTVSHQLKIQKEQRFAAVRVPILEFGVINLQTNPKNAKVILNGKPVGRSPLVIERVSFEPDNEIEIQLDGYETITQNVPVQRPSPYEWKHQLRKGGPNGKLVVVTNPVMPLFINGVSLGMSREESFDVPVGKHEIIIGDPSAKRNDQFMIEVKRRGVSKYFFDLR